MDSGNGPGRTATALAPGRPRDERDEAGTPPQTAGRLPGLGDVDLGALADGQYQAVRRLRSNQRRLSLLLEDLAVLGRLEPGGLRAAAPVDLAQVAAEAARAAAGPDWAVQPVPGTPARVDVDAPDAVVVHGDARLLARALAHLVGDAVRSAPPGGRVAVRVARAAEGAALATVGHEGTDSTGDGDRADAGLGPGLARQVCELHGGTLHVDPHPGGGTTISMRLPVAGGHDGPGLPDDDRELARQAALHEYALLDMPADDELEAVVRLAAAVAGVPTATLNLIDATRQCQLTTVGFDGADSPRTESMCAVRFREGAVVHVPDARVHPDYVANPWVTGERASVRFYASVPLVTPAGHALGTLCVFDDRPGRLAPHQVDLLRDAAAIVVALFERRRQARDLERARTGLEHAVSELERSNAELAEFAAVASHDLRAPLTVVEGYLELVGDLHGEQLGAQGRTWVERARQGVRRTLSLTDALLTYARAGGGACARMPVDLGAVLADVVADLAGQVARSGATVRAAGPLPVVEGDPALLRQLLQNLVSNAVRYSRPGRRPEVTVTAAPADGGWECSVRDNGVGIPVARREQVFALFTTVQGDDAPAARRRDGGHGIGLATCARIVERHGGHIRIDDAPGGGTVVRFTLPGTR